MWNQSVSAVKRTKDAMLYYHVTEWNSFLLRDVTASGLSVTSVEFILWSSLKTSGRLHCWSEASYLHALHTPRHCRHLTALFMRGGTGHTRWKCIKVQVGFIREYHVKMHFLFIAMISPHFSSRAVCAISKKLPVTSIFVTGKHWQFMVIYVWCAAKGNTDLACENLHLLAFVSKAKRTKTFFLKDSVFLH